MNENDKFFVKKFKLGDTRNKSRCMSCDKTMSNLSKTLDCKTCWEKRERVLKEKV